MLKIYHSLNTRRIYNSQLASQGSCYTSSNSQTEEYSSKKQELKNLLGAAGLFAIIGATLIPIIDSDLFPKSYANNLLNKRFVKVSCLGAIIGFLSIINPYTLLNIYSKK